MRDLERAFQAAGAAGWGSVAFARLRPAMRLEDQQKAEALCPGARTVLIAAFPYCAGDRPGNLSLYARGEDYHRVLLRRLTPVSTVLSCLYPGESVWVGADSSPLPEREAARLAGLGILGRHGLIIVPPYGSWVFLGTVLTSAALPLEEAAPAPLCEDCGRCLSACPAGALGAEGLCEGRCLSHLTQKKGELSPDEEALIAAHPYAWGCDLCQRACPHNAGCALSPLREFREGLMDTLRLEDMEGLTNRTFREKYGERAFAWRGPGVLRRNLSLQQGA